MCQLESIGSRMPVSLQWPVILEERKLVEVRARRLYFATGLELDGLLLDSRTQYERRVSTCR